MMESFYLTLISDSCKNIFQSNTAAHFTTQLAQSVCPADSNYEMAVCEVLIQPLAAWKIALNLSPIFVYTDITIPVHVGDTKARLLRVLPPNVLSGHYCFPHPYYIPVASKNIENITISFHSKSGERYYFSDPSIPSTIVLHFRQILNKKGCINSGLVSQHHGVNPAGVRAVF